MAETNSTNGSPSGVAITFEDVYLSFEQNHVLRGVSFHLPVGETKVFFGIAGSGKSTTIAPMPDYIAEPEPLHILTVEDPIEHVHARKKALMSQREIGTHTATFASALKAALREEPDVIVVGELRDTETVRKAGAAGARGASQGSGSRPRTPTLLSSRR